MDAYPQNIRRSIKKAIDITYALQAGGYSIRTEGYEDLITASRQIESLALLACQTCSKKENATSPTTKEASIKTGDGVLTITIGAYFLKRTYDAAARNALTKACEEYRSMGIAPFANAAISITMVYPPSFYETYRIHDPDNIDSTYMLNCLKGTVIEDDSLMNITLKIDAEIGKSESTTITVTRIEETGFCNRLHP